MKTMRFILARQYPVEPKTFRSLILLLTLGCSSYFSCCQVTPISGIVNSYFKVIEVIPAKSCLRVTNPAGLSSNDKVMLVQMKGASINTNAGSSSFGTISAMNNAGNYEMNTVCTVI